MSMSLETGGYAEHCFQHWTGSEIDESRISEPDQLLYLLVFVPLKNFVDLQFSSLLSASHI